MPIAANASYDAAIRALALENQRIVEIIGDRWYSFRAKQEVRAPYVVLEPGPGSNPDTILDGQQRRFDELFTVTA